MNDTESTEHLLVGYASHRQQSQDLSPQHPFQV